MKNETENTKERELRKSRNYFELEGNISSLDDIRTNANGKVSLRFDLAQNIREGESQFIPIIIKGAIVDTYGKVVEKGDWIKVKGRINAYTKTTNKGKDNEHQTKVVEVLGFEIENLRDKTIYKSDGQVVNNKEKEMEK